MHVKNSLQIQMDQLLYIHTQTHTWTEYIFLLNEITLCREKNTFLHYYRE